MDSFEIGGAYRGDESISGLAIFKVAKTMWMGYAYEAALSNSNRNMDNGTHEIMLQLKL